MKPINIIVSSLTFSSFSYVAKVTKQLLLSLTNNNVNPNDITISTTYQWGKLNLLIEDAYISINLPKFADVAWLDTALKIERLNSYRQCKIYACSNKDKNELENVGIKVEDIIPRPFNPIAYAYLSIPSIGFHIDVERLIDEAIDIAFNSLYWVLKIWLDYKGASRWSLSIPSIGFRKKRKKEKNNLFIMLSIPSIGFSLTLWSQKNRHKKIRVWV